MTSPHVLIITGHPATGKTTLANFLALELGLPFISKDAIKETLFDTLIQPLTEPPTSWSRQLSVATWALLYNRVEMLLKGNVSFIVESNFDPVYADEQWQRLTQIYSFQAVQIRCETEPELLLESYKARINRGERHPGHVDDSQNQRFLASIQQPMGWIDLPGERIPFDTTEIHYNDTKPYKTLVKSLSRIGESSS